MENTEWLVTNHKGDTMSLPNSSFNVYAPTNPVMGNVWSSEMPTVPGWYWYRRDGNYALCQVSQFDIDNKNFVTESEWWSLPIPHPQ
jgi:hypothetical protein